MILEEVTNVVVINSTDQMVVDDYEPMLSPNEISKSNQCLCIGEINEKDYSQNYATYNLIVIIILLPIVALFGLCSNIVNIIIFTRPRMITSSSVYLTALASSDFLVVITGLFIFCFDSARAYVPDITFFATDSIIWILPVGYMAQTGSVYFTVGAAIDCYLSVCWEPFSRSYCTVRRAKQFVLFVVVFTLGYNTLRFWQFFLHECYYHGELTVEICTTDIYDKVNVIYNVYMYMILMTFLPFILLSILNALIVRSVQKIKNNRRKASKTSVVVNHYQHPYQLCPTSPKITISLPGSPTANSLIITTDDNARGDDTVITMVMVVIMFLACNVLALVINVVETFFKPDRLLLNYLSDTSNFLVVFNSSVNFLIYILFDGQYRKVLLAAVRPCADTTSANSNTTKNGNHRSEIRTESTLQTLVSNDGCETSL